MRSWPAPSVPRLPSGLRPELRVHDSASTTLVEVPGTDGVARMYVCGITPYDATHMGHAATYVAFDLLNRAWRNAGHEVRYVQNVTDVDDPLLERAVETGQDWTALAERETELFRADMEALRVLPPDEYVGAVESIPLVVTMIEELRENGAVYPVPNEEGDDDRQDALDRMPVHDHHGGEEHGEPRREAEGDALGGKRCHHIRFQEIRPAIQKRLKSATGSRTFQPRRMSWS